MALEVKISDIGPLKYFLALEIQFSTNDIFVQAKYLNDLLYTSGMTSAKSCTTPMSTTLDLYTTAPPFNDPSLYGKLVGFLRYLTFTRPYITFSVNCVSQFMHKPTSIHFSAVKCILQYLCGTPTLGIHFCKGSFSFLYRSRVSFSRHYYCWSLLAPTTSMWSSCSSHNPTNIMVW